MTYPDKNPVGTGAFTRAEHLHPAEHHLHREPALLADGPPKVETVNYPAFLTNDTANTYLANGQAQWGGQFIPNIQKFYTSKNPNYHYWFPPMANVIAVHQPDEPDPEERRGSPGHGVRDQPAEGVHHR